MIASWKAFFAFIAAFFTSLEKAGNALVELSTVAEEAAETFRLKAQVENAHDLATLRAQLAIPAAPAPTKPTK